MVLMPILPLCTFQYLNFVMVTIIVIVPEREQKKNEINSIKFHHINTRSPNTFKSIANGTQSTNYNTQKVSVNFNIRSLNSVNKQEMSVIMLV